MKDKKQERDLAARVVIYHADHVGHLVYAAKWLKQTANEMIKNAKKQNKTGKPVYSSRYIARLWN